MTEAGRARGSGDHQHDCKAAQLEPAADGAACAPAQQRVLSHSARAGDRCHRGRGRDADERDRADRACRDLRHSHRRAAQRQRLHQSRRRADRAGARRADARHHGMVAPPAEDLERRRPDRGQCVARRPAVAARQHGGERTDHDLERLRRFGRPRGRLYPDRLGRGLAARTVPQSAAQRSAADRRLRRGGRDRGGLRRADHRRLLCLRADRRRLCGGERGADPGRFARGRADRAISRRRALFAGDLPCRHRRPRAISGADRAGADRERHRHPGDAQLVAVRARVRAALASGLDQARRSAASSSAALRSSRRRCSRPATARWCSTCIARWRSASSPS